MLYFKPNCSEPQMISCSTEYFAIPYGSTGNGLACGLHQHALLEHGVVLGLLWGQLHLTSHGNHRRQVKALCFGKAYRRLESLVYFLLGIVLGRPLERGDLVHHLVTPCRKGGVSGLWRLNEIGALRPYFYK